MSMELGRPYHPPPFSTIKRSDALGVTGFDKGNVLVMISMLNTWSRA